MSVIYTIGHSTHSAEEFLRLLEGQEITAIADVRSSPFSCYNPQYNRDSLKNRLRSIGINYVFLGNELGARSKEPAHYENGQVQYDRIAESDMFKRGLNRVEKGAKEYRIALMCAEKEPLDCHRTILVARALVRKGHDVRHILSDGTAEGHQETINRLVRNLSNSLDLFMSTDEMETVAYRLREQEIAFAGSTGTKS